MTHTPLIDMPTFQALCGTAGEAFVGELLDAFAEELPAMLAELRAARAATSEDRFRRAAHSLKTNALTFGALQLGDQARTMENAGLPVDEGALHALEAAGAEALATLRELARG